MRITKGSLSRPHLSIPIRFGRCWTRIIVIRDRLRRRSLKTDGMRGYEVGAEGSSITELASIHGWLAEYRDQATYGARWMPWHREAMKDVVSCEKPGGAAHKL